MSVDFADGFDVEVIGDVSDDLICVICSKLMKDAVEMSCGHGMCEGCCKRLIQSCKNRNVASSCPQCRKNIKENEIRPVMMVRRLISSLKINCPEENMGCDWNGELGNLKDHDQQCPYGYVTCPNDGCLRKMIRKNLEEHSMKCDYRSIECCHCGIDYVASDHQIHLKECQHLPVTCPFRCEVALPRKDIEHHFETCKNKPVPCPYHVIGCSVQIERDDIKTHMEECVSAHSLLLLQHQQMKDMELQESRKEVEDLTKVVDEMKNENLKDKIEMDILKERLKSYHDKTVVLDKELIALDLECSTAQGRSRNLEERVASLEKQLSDAIEEVKELKKSKEEKTGKTLEEMTKKYTSQTNHTLVRKSIRSDGGFCTFFDSDSGAGLIISSAEVPHLLVNQQFPGKVLSFGKGQNMHSRGRKWFPLHKSMSELIDEGYIVDDVYFVVLVT